MATKTETCIACGREDLLNEEWWACKLCVSKYPGALLKSLSDPFSYFLRTVDGMSIHYQEATINSDWVFLFGINSIHPELLGDMERGLHIRFDQIAMVADAPFGH